MMNNLRTHSAEMILDTNMTKNAFFDQQVECQYIHLQTSFQLVPLFWKAENLLYYQAEDREI